jgi:hypothetical protein
VIRVLGLAREHIVFCGDSLKDGELAFDNGLSFVGRLGTFTGDEFRRWNAEATFVDSIPALAALLEARAAA